MKFTVSYSRKVRTGAYEMLEIGAMKVSDTGLETMDYAFSEVRDFVEEKIDKERDRILEKSVKKPERDQ